jgi:hypothetical protein
MNEEKNKDKRLEEKEKLDAEAQRSYAVAEMKKAHKLIEETEKSRKRPSIQSVCLRIDVVIKDFSVLVQMYGKTPFAGNDIVDSIKRIIQGYAQVYESICYDFQKTMEIKDEDMAKLFPRIEIDMKNGYSVSGCLFNIVAQLKHMRIYCERMLY